MLHPLRGTDLPPSKTTWFNQGAPAAEWTHPVLLGVFLCHSRPAEDRGATSEETYHEPAVPPTPGFGSSPMLLT